MSSSEDATPQNPEDAERDDPQVVDNPTTDSTGDNGVETAAANSSETTEDVPGGETGEELVEEPNIDPELVSEIDEALTGIELDDAVDQEADIEQQLAERTEDLQRITAEYTNYRRRTERERNQIIETAKASVVTQLLPVLDDLDLADQHGDLSGPLKTFSDKFRSIIAGMQVEAFGEHGDKFDPETHEAVQDLSTGPEKIIGDVLRKGYRIGDKTIRSAMVSIADPE